ncbi:DUF4468 domain-containing protein [Sphingobacterium faecium]
MKQLFLALLFVISSKAFSQDIPDIPIKDGVVEYSEVVDVNVSKDVLYSNLKAWTAKYFVSGKTVTELDDQANGKLIAKANATHTFNYLGHPRKTNFRIMLQVDCKDNKYRYIINILEYEHSTTSQTIPELIEIAAGRKKSFSNNKKYALKQLDVISSTIEPMISSLKSGMDSSNDDF